MAIYLERTKKEFNLNDSCPAHEDLSNRQFTCVRAVAAAAGNSMEVSAPAAQGGLMYGVLTNEPTAQGQVAAIIVEGIIEIRADSAIAAGAAVTVAGTNGRIETAAAGDYVVGTAREAANGAGHAISVHLNHYYAV